MDPSTWPLGTPPASVWIVTSPISPDAGVDGAPQHALPPQAEQLSDAGFRRPEAVAALYVPFDDGPTAMLLIPETAGTPLIVLNSVVNAAWAGGVGAAAGHPAARGSRRAQRPQDGGRVASEPMNRVT